MPDTKYDLLSPQLPSQYLAHISFGQFFSEFHHFRYFITGQVLFTMFDYFAFGQSLPDRLIISADPFTSPVCTPINSISAPPAPWL